MTQPKKESKNFTSLLLGIILTLLGLVGIAVLLPNSDKLIIIPAILIIIGIILAIVGGLRKW